MESILDSHWLYVGLVGLIAGLLGKAFMPGRDPGGFIVTILIGIVGAVIGGFLANFIGLGARGWIGWEIIIATIGAVILLWLYRIVTRKTA